MTIPLSEREILFAWLVCVSVFAFFQMGFDKRRARVHGRRVPERALFAAALLGGSAGSCAGMYFFRHKTKHWYFKYGMPLILLVQAAFFGYALWRGWL